MKPLTLIVLIAFLIVPLCFCQRSDHLCLRVLGPERNHFSFIYAGTTVHAPVDANRIAAIRSLSGNRLCLH